MLFDVMHYNNNLMINYNNNLMINFNDKLLPSCFVGLFLILLIVKDIFGITGPRTLGMPIIENWHFLRAC